MLARVCVLCCVVYCVKLNYENLVDLKSFNLETPEKTLIKFRKVRFTHLNSFFLNKYTQESIY